MILEQLAINHFNEKFQLSFLPLHQLLFQSEIATLSLPPPKLFHEIESW